MWHLLPRECWDNKQDLVPPSQIETVVLKALNTAHHSVRAFITMTKCNYDDIPDDIFTTIIREMIVTRLCHMKTNKIPYMTDLTLHILCSICKNMINYNDRTVKKYMDHYIVNGTSGFDNLAPESDDNYKFFLFFIDIKTTVNVWMTGYSILTLHHAWPTKKMDWNPW
jgi:hypothetical protein